MEKGKVIVSVEQGKLPSQLLEEANTKNSKKENWQIDIIALQMP